jgi:hypothetical protein
MLTHAEKSSALQVAGTEPGLMHGMMMENWRRGWF